MVVAFRQLEIAKMPTISYLLPLDRLVAVAAVIGHIVAQF